MKRKANDLHGAMTLEPRVGIGRAAFDERAASGWRGAAGRMVDRVLAAAGTGEAGLLEWIEAWATAAVIDGRYASIAVDGDDVVVDAGTRRAVLAVIDVGRAEGGSSARSSADLAMTIRNDGDGPVLHVVATDGRNDRYAIAPEQSMRLDLPVEGVSRPFVEISRGRQASSAYSQAARP